MAWYEAHRAPVHLIVGIEHDDSKWAKSNAVLIFHVCCFTCLDYYFLLSFVTKSVYYSTRCTEVYFGLNFYNRTWRSEAYCRQEYSSLHTMRWSRLWTKRWDKTSQQHWRKLKTTPSYIEGLIQNRRNSSVWTVQLRLFRIKPPAGCPEVYTRQIRVLSLTTPPISCYHGVSNCR